MIKTLKILLPLFILLTISKSALATETGCLLPNNQLYTNKVNSSLINVQLGSTPIYENNSSINLAQQCISSSNGPCSVCNAPFSSSLGLITGCPTGFVYGSEIEYFMNCDIDSGNMFLMVLSGSAGLYFIYKRPK